MRKKKKKPCQNSFFLVNALPVFLPHMYRKDVISAYNCSLTPITKLIIGPSLPGRVPVFPVVPV